MSPRSPHDRALRLVPGVRVVRRGSDHLQVGLYAGRRVVLRRTPASETALDLVVHGLPLPQSLHRAVPGLLSDLERAGLAAPVADLAESARRRRRTRAAVLGELPGLAAEDLLRGSGLEVTDTARADTVLVLSHGELPREHIDPLLRQHTAHVVVRLVDGAAVIGPFVVPGVTACLRCIDAHEAVHDPHHAIVTSRYAEATRRPRADGDVGTPSLPLALLATATAVQDVLTHLDGGEPATWSRTRHLAPDGTETRTRGWLRHPECGCCWALDHRSSGTMEA